ncbi:MAG: zinc ABC transporter substrate-binding protein [Chlamydiales bacterium]|nr:zinc ABC transporter substrate-binding protein [Chlamydiales bacterium]
MHLFFLFFVFLASFLTAQEKPRVLVSIAPEKFFVERIADDSVVVDVLVPPGASPHSFEPSPKQIINASRAIIWFRIGEPFEPRAIDVLTSHKPNMIIIDTRKDIPLLTMDSHAKCKGCSQHGDDKDTHIWLSPRLAQVQAKTIKDALITAFPENRELYEKNFCSLIHDLQDLDKELILLFQSMPVRYILVSHPAFGYLGRDYNFVQLSLEIEGKDPSSRQLTELLNKVRSLNLTRVFTQEQYQNKGALLIAKEINAQIYSVDPYSGDYLNNLKKIGLLFSNH